MGFWSTLGKIGLGVGGAVAAPFTGGASLWPTLIGVGGSVAGGLLGSRAAKPSSLEQNAINQQLSLQRTQQQALEQGIGYAGGLQPQASQLFGQGSGAISPAIDYWQKILSGRPEMMEALSPEIRRINQGYTQAANSVRQFAPSGGGRAALLAEAPFRAAGDTSSLIATARPAAATNLAGTGTNLMNLAGNLQSNILQALMGGGAGAGRTGEGLLNYGQQNRQMGWNMGSQIGKSIFDIIQSLPFGKGKSGGGGGSSTTTLNFPWFTGGGG